MFTKALPRATLESLVNELMVSVATSNDKDEGDKASIKIDEVAEDKKESQDLSEGNDHGEE